MPRYTFNGKTYNIPDEKVDSFLTKNLSAEPLNINSFSDVETTEQTEKKQEQDFVNQQAVQTDNPDDMVFEDLPEQYGLSDVEQGAFGQQANYFVPTKPSLPEVKLEEYVSKAELDPEKLNKKIFGEDYEKWKTFQAAESKSDLTSNQVKEVNNNVNEIFKLNEDGSINNVDLNPQGLRDDAYYDKKAKGDDWEPVADIFFETVDDIKDFGSKALNLVGIGDGKQVAIDEADQVKIDTQNEFLKKAKENLKSSDPKKEPTEQEILMEARKLYTDDLTVKKYKKNVVDNIIKAKNSDGKYGLGMPEDQEALSEMYDMLNGKMEKASAELTVTSKNAANSIELINKKFKKLIEKTPDTTEEYLQTKVDLEKLAKERNKHMAVLEQNQLENEFIVKNVEEIAEYGNLIGRNYNGITQFAGILGASGIDLGVNILNFADKFSAKNIVKNIALPAMESLLPEKYIPVGIAVNALKQASPEFKSFYDDEGKFDELYGYSDYLRSAVAEPISYDEIKSAKDWGNWALQFTAAQAPQIGLMVLAPGAALPLLGAASGGGKFRSMEMEMKNGATYSPWQMYGAAIMTGGGEVLSEKLTLGQLKRLKVRNIPVSKAKTSFVDGLKKNVFNFNKVKALAYDVNEEGVGEMFAGFSENLAEKYILGKKDVNLFDGLEEMYVGGVFMSGVLFRAPSIGNQMLAPFKTKNLNSSFDANAANIINLSDQLKKPNLDPKTKSIIENKIDDLVVANSEIRVDQAMSTDYLAPEQKSELISIHKKEFDNKNSIEIIRADNNLDGAAKSEIISGLEIENSKLSQQRDAIMEPAIEAHYKSTTETIKTMAQDVDGVNVKEIEDVSKENIERQKRNNQKMSLAEADGKEVDPSQLEDMLDPNLPGSFNPDTGEIIINKAAALKNKQVNVAAHEFLHGIMAQTFKGNPAAQKAFGKSVLSELGKIEGIDTSKFSSRINQYQKAVDAGTISEADAYEEAMNLLGDAIATKDVKLPETFLGKIGKLITDAAGKLGWSTKFNKGSDVVSFVKNFQKEVSQGKLSSQTLQVAKEGAKGKLAKTKPAKAKPKTVTKSSLPTIKGVKPKAVKDAVGKVANRAAAKFYRGIPRNIREKAGLDRATYIRSAQTELAQIAQKYDPSRKDKDGNQVSFDRYMANTGMQRLNSLATRLGVESSEQGVTQSLDSPQAQQVADTTAETDTTLDTKPIIDVMNFAKKADPSIDVKKFEQDFTDGVNKLAQEKGIDITSPNLTPKQLQAITPYDVLAKAIGIPANKLSNAADNLSKSESLKAQRILLAAKPFIKNVVLGQANKQVQTVASKKKGGKPVKVGGESLGLGRNILNTFFNPPKRVGNNLVRTPKKFDNKIYDAAIGIKDGKVDPNYVPRASESQTIKGLLKGVAEQMANRGARNILDTKTQTSNVVTAKANLERGKSKLMFSLAKPINKQVSEYKNRMKPQDKFLRGKDGKKVLGGKQNQTIKNRIKNKIVPELKNILTPKEKVVLLYTMQGTGASKTNPNFGRSGMIYPNSAQAMEALGITKEQVKELNKSPELQLALRYAGKAVLSTSGLSLNKINEIKNNKSTQDLIAKENEAKKNILFDIIKKITNLVANKPKLANGINHVLGLQSDYQGHFIRKLIPFVSFTDTKFLEDGIHDEHYSKSLRTTRFVQSMVDQAAARGLEYTNKELIDDLNDLWTGMGRGIVSKIEGNKFDEKKGIGEQQYIAQSPMIEVLGKVQDAKNHFVLPFTEANPSSELKTLEEVGEVIKNKEFLDQKKLNAENTIQKGEDALANNPNLKPSLPDPAQLDSDINNMIQDTKGIKAKYRFSDIVAKRRGAGVRNFKLIPSGAQDFNGLMYDLYGKGKKGEAQQKWVKDNLVKPYQDGIAKIDKYRQALKNDYSALLKKYPNVSNKLGEIIPGTEFTLDQALRVNLWTQGGFEIPGLSKRDIKKLNNIVNKDPELKLFNESALAITKQPKWVAPSPHWDVESLISDLNSLTTKVGRKQYLAEFIANKNAIFSNENLNKMEVALGTNWREAMEDSLYRMENGTNRPSGTNKLTNDFLNWVNNSVGAIMFMNVKSALLQTISSVNFLNWSDNNPFKAALALANFPQYVKDFSFLWNSPKLVQRRSGLRKDINEAELANAAKGAKNKPAAMLSYLLKLGFTPTQLADSFAIASGGATFYRNRLNTYKKQGLSEAEASDKAFEDFAEASDVAQQSADPMLISQQQASVLGRLLLAFQNTPAQVTRIFNKASRDFINGRGDQKTNISKMIYYGAVQGFIFAALQNAAFALIPGFDDEEDKEKKSKEFDKKEERILNSMVDTMLRGSGVYGAIVSTLKNTALTYYREEKKDAFGKDHRNTLLEILNLSPPVGSKVRKINNAIKAKDYNEEVVKEQGWDVTLKGKVNLSPSYQVIASLTEAITNLPLERAVVEIDRVVEMLDARNTTFQRVALALGYRTWDVNTKNEERDLVKVESKKAKEEARKRKVIEDRAERKRLKEIEKYKGKTEEEIKQMKRRDSIVNTNKSAQITSLKNLGLTTKQIKELKYEDDRVNKIIELTNK